MRIDLGLLLHEDDIRFSIVSADHFQFLIRMVVSGRDLAALKVKVFGDISEKLIVKVLCLFELDL